MESKHFPPTNVAKSDQFEPKVQTMDETSHQSRQTKSGFLVDGPLLTGFVPTPPSKKPPYSWTWSHGEPITRLRSGERL